MAEKQLLRQHEVAKILGINPDTFIKRGYKPVAIEHGIKLYDIEGLHFIDKRKSNGKAK